MSDQRLNSLEENYDLDQKKVSLLFLTSDWSRASYRFTYAFIVMWVDVSLLALRGHLSISLKIDARNQKISLGFDQLQS